MGDRSCAVIDIMQKQIEKYLRHKMPEAKDLTVSGIFRIPGGASRETWAFDARWREIGRAHV